jgi:uncharacterized protein YbdZ (MbtH family)
MAGTITKGTDGIIRLVDTAAEVPCLREWTLETSTTETREAAGCMVSNGDDASSLWETVVAVGRGWQVSLTFYWQRSEEAAAPSFAPERVGEALNIELLPTNAVRAYAGIAAIQSVSKPAEVGTNITQTVNLVGDGALIYSALPAVSGTAPAEDSYSLTGEEAGYDVSTWFTGSGLSFAADVLPLGYTLEADTGLFTGTLTSADLPLDVTITATNTRGSVSHTVTWNTWDALGAAQAWYDTTPSTLKTDLVASFTQANAESLSLYTPLGHELHPSGEFTFSTWVKGAAGGVGSTQNIIENFASNVGGYRLMALGDGRLYWELTTQAYEIDGSLDGNWQFLTLGWDGSNMVTSINGVVTKFSKTTPLQGPTRDFRLGRDADFDMGPTGAWGRALTSAEITAVYNSGTPRSYANMTTAEKVSLVSFWELWEPRGTRYDSHGTNHLTDINTVGAAQGPVEIQAGEYAGVTKWENQGLAASPFGDVAINAPGDAPQFIGGVLVYDVLSNALRTASGETLGDSTIVFVGSKDAAAPSDAYAVDSNNPAFRRILYVPSGKYRAYSNGVLSWASGAITDRVLVFASFTSTDVTLQVAADVFATGTGTTEAMKGLSVGGINSLSSAYNWVGTIDSVIVFGRLLTATEKAALTAHFALA